MAAVVLLWPSAGCTAERPTGVRFRPAGPDEEIWTVRCQTLEGPNRFRTARNIEQALKKVKGLDPRLVRVFHDEASSVVYYGRYERRYSAASGEESFKPDPLPDLKLIRQLSLTANGENVWPFALAVLDAWPASSSGNPAWDLNNVDGYWSLQVAVFYNEGEMRQRKRAAAEYCRLLRQEHNVEAYYHHGVVHSSVCVGIFPKDAIVDVQREDPLTGVVRATNKIVDPHLRELQKKFPYNLQNGHKLYELIPDPSTGKKQRIPHPSFPVKLPRADQPRTPQPGG